MFDAGDTWMMATSPGPGLWHFKPENLCSPSFFSSGKSCWYVKFILIILINYIRCLKGQCHEIFDFCFFKESVCTRCHWYRWCTLTCEYLRSKKFETDLMGYSGDGGKLIHAKKRKQKISWHCPFKGTIGREDSFKHNEQDHRKLFSKKCRNYVEITFFQNCETIFGWYYHFLQTFQPKRQKTA